MQIVDRCIKVADENHKENYENSWGPENQEMYSEVNHISLKGKKHTIISMCQNGKTFEFWLTLKFFHICGTLAQKNIACWEACISTFQYQQRSWVSQVRAMLSITKLCSHFTVDKIEHKAKNRLTGQNFMGEKRLYWFLVPPESEKRCIFSGFHYQKRP